MTTIKDVRNVVQPLLQRYDDLALIGRTIVVKPVHHFVRGVRLERRMDPKLFLPTTDIYILFGYGHYPLGGFGDRFNDPASETPSVSDPHSIEAMFDLIEKEVLPYLRSMQTLESYIAFASQREFQSNYVFGDPIRFFLAIALGDFASALSIWESNSILRSNMDRLTPSLHPALRGEDEGELARLLHARERITVYGLKLTKIWETTPFPLELGIRSNSGIARLP